MSHETTWLATNARQHWRPEVEDQKPRAPTDAGAEHGNARNGVGASPLFFSPGLLFLFHVPLQGEQHLTACTCCKRRCYCFWRFCYFGCLGQLSACVNCAALPWAVLAFLVRGAPGFSAQLLSCPGWERRILLLSCWASCAETYLASSCSSRAYCWRSSLKPGW